MEGLKLSLCDHLAVAPADVTAQSLGCTDCEALGVDTWVHLRLCLTCGHVGCCDSSPYRHATAHFRDSQHPVVRSYEPGEHWRWCYVHEQVG